MVADDVDVVPVVLGVCVSRVAELPDAPAAADVLPVELDWVPQAENSAPSAPSTIAADLHIMCFASREWVLCDRRGERMMSCDRLMDTM
jgi:hypothetical protein